ncbi:MULTISPECIES: hypothetical protein [unclassified Bradyrhizobium]|uniref:hypothetical protein n=1 Tax=unclassified Bradyrhizobium TaxID=2631580 RepID=UPI0028ECF478|nr:MULTISPECIES: hypothetical protein [unclassified Bradyrhizobium]
MGDAVTRHSLRPSFGGRDKSTVQLGHDVPREGPMTSSDVRSCPLLMVCRQSLFIVILAIAGIHTPRLKSSSEIVDARASNCSLG